MMPCLFHPARGSRQAGPVMLCWLWPEPSGPAAPGETQGEPYISMCFLSLPARYLLWVSGTLSASLQDSTVGFLSRIDILHYIFFSENALEHFLTGITIHLIRTLL